MKTLIIVPDVHGRTFWKDVMEYKDTPIVFLGDYLDPYPRENIGKQQAIDNFLEILDYAKQNNNVTLLLGNHDMEYSIGTHICDCRRDVKNYKTIQNLFWKTPICLNWLLILRWVKKSFLFHTQA